MASSPNGIVAPAGFPVPPPLANVPIGYVRDGLVYMSEIGLDYNQSLWASVQGAGGLLDLLLESLPSEGVTSGLAQALIDQIGSTLTLLTPQVNAAALGETIDEGQLFPAPLLGLAALAAAIDEAVLLAQRPVLPPQSLFVGAVADLPTVAPDGTRGLVTDGSVVAAGNFGTVIAGGGTNHVPVYYENATPAWRIG